MTHITRLLARSLLVLGVCLSPAVAAAEGWPATPEGALARGWVNAFCSGEDSMRVYLERHMAPKSLATRSTRVRVEKYRSLRDQYGKLQLTRVFTSKPGELVVRLMDSNAKEREFVFATQTAPVAKLLSVSIREQQSGHRGMFGFHP
ncbi:MAG: hypothetical protein IT348_11430 [Candidatus Eisenbacteria bacterium]|nr:hypothetical protein [Candidatus Eisenbacteria bacterium]